MVALLLRLFALRPLLAASLFGLPILLLIAVGLFTVWALKIAVFVVLPIVAIWWLVKRLRRSSTATV
jgi:hypothetical protein